MTTPNPIVRVEVPLWPGFHRGRRGRAWDALRRRRGAVDIVAEHYQRQALLLRVGCIEEDPVDVRVYVRLPWPERSLRQHPTDPPAVVEYAQRVLRSLRGVAYRHESQVCSLTAWKLYHATPGVVVEVERVDQLRRRPAPIRRDRE